MASEATASLTLGSWSPGLRYPSRSACSTCWTSCRYVGTPEAGSSRKAIGEAGWRAAGEAGEEPSERGSLSIVIGQDYNTREPIRQLREAGLCRAGVNVPT